MTANIDALIAEARRPWCKDCDPFISRLADTLKSVYADSLTAQAEHARWQERAEKAERAGERILADALARSAEVRKERERAAALAEQGTEEPEWEYECRVDAAWDWRPCTELAAFCPKGSERRRRRKAGPWMPVEQGNEDA